MKTLKEELQEIVDEDKLNENSRFICVSISNYNKTEFSNYREMAKKYARDYVADSDYAWWYDINSYVISEKKRFIRDLIKIL